MKLSGAARVFNVLLIIEGSGYVASSRTGEPVETNTKVLAVAHKLYGNT